MRLSSLIADLDIAAPTSGLDAIDVTGLSADSRLVGPGTLFAALAGTKANGSRFVADAAAKGAVAVLVAEHAEVPAGLTVPVLRTKEPRRTLATCRAVLRSQPETVVAVTGTSGKTSVAAFTRADFAAAGRKAARIGTTGVVKPDRDEYGSLTTPDPVALHAMLARTRGRRRHACAMEASATGSTNAASTASASPPPPSPISAATTWITIRRSRTITTAKMRLFETLLPKGAPAVINLDAPRGVR